MDWADNWKKRKKRRMVRGFFIGVGFQVENSKLIKLAIITYDGFPK